MFLYFTQDNNLLTFFVKDRLGRETTGEDPSCFCDTNVLITEIPISSEAPETGLVFSLIDPLNGLVSFNSNGFVTRNGFVAKSYGHGLSTKLKEFWEF
ncbi:hypothetical protein AVEN_188063-1 [Araneus ventricosus]|uniref:Uncharacterized protein n=1 Tax=Araneus ventricosus TaxID=182803 RepID=A0A4Y2T371_ARAVE|nr:hypothetical protein AVEN_188063-1 [Araneus ventricosus]